MTMTLERIKATEVSRLSYTKPRISFIYHGGAVYLNSSCVNLMGLKEGDSINFFQDKEDCRDWYISKGNNADNDSFVLRRQKTALGFYSKQLCKLFLNSQKKQTSYSFMIATMPVEGELYAILSLKI